MKPNTFPYKEYRTVSRIGYWNYLLKLVEETYNLLIDILYCTDKIHYYIKPEFSLEDDETVREAPYMRRCKVMVG